MKWCNKKYRRTDASNKRGLELHKTRELLKRSNGTTLDEHPIWMATITA